MNNRTLIALGVTAAVLYLVWQRSRQPAQAQLVPAQLLDWAASPQQDAAYWALMSGGTPSTAGSTGTGTTTPGTLTQWLGRVFGGTVGAWKAPNAATNPIAQTSSAQPGAVVLPGPLPPEVPTPQSAVQSSSPYLPASFMLAAPVSSSAWALDATLADPLGALLIGGGDFIDVQQTPFTPRALPT